MRRREFVALLSATVARTLVAQPAGQPGPRVGVLIQGGSYYSSVDGLREGLKDAGLQEGQ
jgi:putative ABC transport system substrate-binding protein